MKSNKSEKEDLEEILWQYSFTEMIVDLSNNGFSKKEIESAILKVIGSVCKK